MRGRRKARRRDRGYGRAATEGIYWKYESKLKELDDRLYSAVGAAGELFAVRRELWQTLREDTLLDDFVCSMLIAAQGYRIAYCKGAYALETPSADMGEEGKRKKRIAAGGLQSVWRLRKLLNPFRYGVLWFQYVSHRVLRWTLTPVVLAALLPLNVALLWSGHRRSMPRPSPCNAHSTWPPSQDGRWSAADTATDCSSSPTTSSS